MLKKNHPLAVLFFMYFISVGNTMSQIPVFEWASNQQYVSNFHEKSITTDSNENVIVTGYFSGYHDFDPGPADLIIQASGNTGIFVFKLDPQGNLLWVRTFGSVSVDNRGVSVVTDSSGNIYFNGTYGNTIDFDPGPNVYNLSPVTGVSLGFIVSLDTNGDFRWAHSVPGFSVSGVDYNEIAYSPDGTILLTERFTGTIDFDPGPNTYNMTSSSIGDMYILKLDLDGNFIWSKSFEGAFQQANSVAVHSSGNIFATGFYSGTADLDPGINTHNISSIGLWDNYVVKLNSLGDFIWGTSFGGAQFDEANEVDIDNQENIYVSGLFSGTSDFDPGTNTQNYTSNGDRDPYLLKLGPTGSFEWFHNYGGYINDNKIAVSIDNSDNIFVTGRFYDTLDFEPGPGVSNQVTDNTGTNIFISKLTPTGGLSWVKSFDGTGFNIGTSIHCASSGNFYVAGEYDETVDFNPGFGNAIYFSVGGSDGFNLKYSQCNQSTPIPTTSTLSDTVSNCSIDSLTIPTATENCTGTILGVPDVSFPINTIGTTIVTWTFDAGNGFSTTQSQNVIILDTIPPIPDMTNLNDLSFVCSTSSLPTPSASDNCSNSISITNNASFPITSNTQITWTYDDGNGNTSSQIQNVIITPIDNSVNLSNGINLTANANGYIYQWIDCTNGNTPIPGETDQSFFATENGNYAVEISNNICSVVSDCITIDQVNIIDNGTIKPISIFPNPSQGKLTIDLHEQQYQNVSIKVSDAVGQLISNHENILLESFEINLTGDSGIYFISLTFDNGTHFHYRVLKQ